MGRSKGSKKTGGRSKGTPNKRTDELLALLDEFSYNPVRALMQKYSNLSSSEQLKVDLKMLEHVYPKLKDQQIELQATVYQDEFDDMTTEELEQFIRDMSDYWEPGHHGAVQDIFLK